MKEIFKINNFDLIRLLAAMQVAFQHVSAHFNLTHNWLLTNIVTAFPGVPVFFFVSGFLISKSYENNPVISEYALNRILRIYPALIVCTIASLLSILLTGYFTNVNISFSHLAIWIMGQISVVQFYNPDFMRGFGTGVLNGSLWTITVELQFYILVPILYWFIGLRDNTEKNRHNVKLVFVAVLSMIFSIIPQQFAEQYSRTFIFKLFQVSIFPHFWMFVLGILFQRNFKQAYHMLEGKFLYILIFYLASFFGKKLLGWPGGVAYANYLMLFALVFSFAYSVPTFSDRLLRKNDISYGIYIYHIPIINLFIFYGWIENLAYGILVLGLTAIAGSISWRFIEKPAIQMKKHPLKPILQEL